MKFKLRAALALIVLASACRHPHESARVRDAGTAHPSLRSHPWWRPRSLFAGTATSTHLTRWFEQAPIADPFVTAVDGSAAVLANDGRLRWVSARNGAPEVTTLPTPCRFTPAQHTRLWTIAPRVALDGAGHVCCIHEGDDTAAAGAYCATLAFDQPSASGARARPHHRTAPARATARSRCLRATSGARPTRVNRCSSHFAATSNRGCRRRRAHAPVTSWRPVARAVQARGSIRRCARHGSAARSRRS